MSSPHPPDHLLMFKTVLEQWFPAQEIGAFTVALSTIQGACTRESPWRICVLGTAAGIEPIRTAVRPSTRADMRLRARRFD